MTHTTQPPVCPVEIRSNMEFANHDGVRLAGDFYLPSISDPHRLVIAYHGGGWQMGEAARCRYWGECLAARGIGLFVVTYRLWAPGRARVFTECFHDARAAEFNVDPERIALMGDSAGGHLAAMVALAGDHPQFAGAYADDPHAKVSTRMKAVVPIYGVFDLYQQWQHDIVARPRDSITENLLGVSAIDDKRAYFDASLLSWITGRDNDTAFLVVWGTRDDIVDHVSQSEAFMLALKQAGHFVRPMTCEGTPHFWVREPVDEAGA